MRQLGLFKGARQRGEKPPPPLEFHEHCLLADAIKRSLMPGWRATHLPFGEYRNKATAIRLHRMGTGRGWPDQMFLGPDKQLVFLELKRVGGRVAPEQGEIHDHIRSCGFEVSVAFGGAHAIEILQRRGILTSKLRVV